MLRQSLGVCRTLVSVGAKNELRSCGHGSVSTKTLFQKRFYAAPPKRFYKKTGVLYNDGSYEITLDNRKLKTPAGTLFKVSNEALALAVATEWDAQKKVINQSSMHLTALCSTCIDNPNHVTKEDLIQKIISFLSTDTILFHSSEDDELYKFQQSEWQPVVDKFNEKFSVNLAPSRHLGMPQVSDQDRNTVQKYLASHNFWAIIGFSFAVESLKSVILTLTCKERFISVEKAVLLSRLEEEFQTGHWGRVEWAHDVSQLDLQARVAAAIMFVYLNSVEETVKMKKSAPIT
nr:PREDICTED: ATP synthase mitochondrial F1 complex assembly factor 2 [Bemisia tabaci]